MHPRFTYRFPTTFETSVRLNFFKIIMLQNDNCICFSTASIIKSIMDKYIHKNVLFALSIIITRIVIEHSNYVNNDDMPRVLTNINNEYNNTLSTPPKELDENLQQQENSNDEMFIISHDESFHTPNITEKRKKSEENEKINVVKL